MRKPWAVFIIAVIAAIRAVPCEAQTDEIAFTHVAVVDVQSGNISPDMTALISGQKIRELGSSRVVQVPKQAHAADARGKYLIPGLWDMHVHSLWNAERPALFFPLFLANGVTGVLEMGGPKPARAGTLARPGRFRRGDWPSPGRPRTLRRRPHPVWPGSIKVVTADDGKKAVDSLKSAGADFLKVYTGVSRAAYFGIAVEAKKENFPFVGHVPLEVGVDEASKAGQNGVEYPALPEGTSGIQ